MSEHLISATKLLEWMESQGASYLVPVLEEKIKAGEFNPITDQPDSKLKLYKCPECCEAFTAEDWNKSTRGYFQSEITGIEDTDASDAAFRCPGCTVHSLHDALEVILND